MNLIKSLLFTVTIIFITSCSEEKKFDSVKWKNWTESEASLHTRWLMHKDLLKTYKLKGVSKDSILSLLGKPNQQHSNKFYYNLGYPERGGIDPATMTVFFKNDVVTNTKVTNE